MFFFTFLRLFGGCYSFFVHFKLVLYDSWDDPPSTGSSQPLRCAAPCGWSPAKSSEAPWRRRHAPVRRGAMDSWHLLIIFYVSLYHFWYGKWFFQYVPIWGLCISLNSRNRIPSHGLWAEANPHVLRSSFGTFSNLGDPPMASETPLISSGW
jgi:hypothetical protein